MASVDGPPAPEEFLGTDPGPSHALADWSITASVTPPSGLAVGQFKDEQLTSCVVAKPASGPETFHFVGGCANDQTPTGAPQDSTQWTRVAFQTSNPAESFPVIPVGSKIVSITLIFDEGTDTANPPGETAAGAAGLAVVDNININGKFIRQGEGVQPGEKEEQEKEDDD